MAVKLLRRRRRVEVAQYINGYDYAAGMLLRGEKSPTELESEQIDYSAFDKGMDAALDKLVRLKVIVDDRL